MKKMLNEAIKNVEKRISAYDDENTHCVILQNETIEKDDYWVFFFNTAEFLETGNYSYALAGNAPLIVDKYEGNIYEVGTSEKIEHYMEEFEKTTLPRIREKWQP